MPCARCSPSGGSGGGTSALVFARREGLTPERSAESRTFGFLLLVGLTRACPAQVGGVRFRALAPGPARGYYRKNFAKERFLSEILEELFTGTFGGVFIMVLVSAAVIILLRALYGPRGFFRDPKWDESNKRIRLKEAEERERRLKEWQKRGEQDGD